jgi:hypothetical protein
MEALDWNNPHRQKWYEAILAELEVLEKQNTFGPDDQVGRAMKTKLVFTVTLKNDFTLKYKARLVACGYSQVFGIDYAETFSPTTPIMIVFLLMHLAAHRQYIRAAFDVKAAFLEGEQDFMQFCRLPKEICDGSAVRVQLLKSLYGQKQAPKIWSDLLNKYIEGYGVRKVPSCTMLV